LWSEPTLASSLTVRGVTAGYGAVQVLRGISIDVGAGQTVALLGTNGNGKSTLMKTIAGLLPAQAGEIVFECAGERLDLAGRSPLEIVNLGIALVPEGRHLFGRLTVEENLMLGAYRPAARACCMQNLDYCFEMFPRLAERRAQLAGSMSGGEQQMLAVARALMSDPKILLIDELSVGLAPILVRQLIDKIGELKEQRGLTVLMAEQNFNQAIRIADSGYIIVNGEIAMAATTNAELRNNEIIKTYYLGG